MHVTSLKAAGGMWAASVVASGVGGLGLIGVAYADFMDCSNPEIHESASTPLGWSIAVLATTLPLILGAYLARKVDARLLWLALGVALVEALVWVWVLNPSGCDWTNVLG